MKKTIITTFALIVLFLPTVFAVVLYRSSRSTPVEQNSVYAIDLKAPDGKVYSFKNDSEEEKRMIEFFVKIVEGGQSAGKLSEELSALPFFTVTYYSYDIQTEYKYYFSKSKPSESRFTDGSDQCFKIDPSYVIKFLDGDYASSLYSSSSEAPEMTVAGQKITPAELEWHYLSYSGISHGIKTETSKAVITLDASYTEIPVAFSMLPDSAEIRISDGAKQIYSGTVSAFTEGGYLGPYVKANSVLEAEINATWNDNPALGCGGRARYRLNLNCIYDPPATFRLGEPWIELEEFVVISGKNIEKIEEIEFSSEPELGYQPEFYRDGQYVRALLPITSSLGLSSGKYTFTVKYGDDTSVVSLDVKESTLENKLRKYNYSGKLNTKARTEANIEAFREFVTAVPGSDNALFNGAFVFSAPDSIRAQFGDTINNGKESERFFSNGMAFVAYSGNETTAVNDGVVLSVGTTKYGGNTVVIDHGWGLRSVYYCMKSVSVKEGDKIVKGQEIGKGAASTGYSDGLTVYKELWLNGVPVSYFPLLEGGRTSMVVTGD